MTRLAGPVSISTGQEEIHMRARASAEFVLYVHCADLRRLLVERPGDCTFRTRKTGLSA